MLLMVSPAARCLAHGRRGRILRIALALAIVAALWAWGRSAGPDSTWFATTASFTLLGLLDLARAFVRLPVLLGPVRGWEAKGRCYRRLGVPGFGGLLRRSPLRLLNRQVYLGAQARDPQAIVRELEGAEAAHTLAFIFSALYMMLAAGKGWWAAFAGVALFNLAENLYPVLHLRQVRARIAVLAAQRSRKGSAATCRPVQQHVP